MLKWNYSIALIFLSSGEDKNFFFIKKKRVLFIENTIECGKTSVDNESSTNLIPLVLFLTRSRHEKG